MCRFFLNGMLITRNFLCSGMQVTSHLGREAGFLKRGEGDPPYRPVLVKTSESSNPRISSAIERELS